MADATKRQKLSSNGSLEGGAWITVAVNYVDTNQSKYSKTLNKQNIQRLYMELVLEFFHQNQKSVYDKMGRLMESQLKN